MSLIPLIPHPFTHSIQADHSTSKTEIGVIFIRQSVTNNTMPAIITQTAGLGPHPFLMFGRTSRVFMLSSFLGRPELGDVTYFECLFYPCRSAGARAQWIGPQHLNNQYALGDVTGILHLGTHDPARHRGRSAEEIMMGDHRRTRKKDSWIWLVEALSQLRQPIVARHSSSSSTGADDASHRQATPGMATLTMNHCLRSFGKMLFEDFMSDPLIPLCSIQPRNGTRAALYFEGGRFLEFRVWFWNAIEPIEGFSVSLTRFASSLHTQA